MSRTTGVFSDVAMEKKEMAAFWAWPILACAFVIFGTFEIVLRVVGYFYRGSK